MSEGSFPFSAAVSGAYYAICMRSVGVASHGLRCLDTTYAGFSPLLLHEGSLPLCLTMLLMRVLSLLLFLPPRPFLAHTMPSAYAAWGSHPTGFAALTLHMQGSSPPLLLSRVFSPIIVFSLIFEVNCFELPPYPRWVAALRIVTDRHRRRRPCAGQANSIYCHGCQRFYENKDSFRVHQFRCTVRKKRKREQELLLSG